MIRSVRRCAGIGVLAATSAVVTALAGCSSSPTAQPAPVSRPTPTTANQVDSTTSTAPQAPPPATTTSRSGGSGGPPNCDTTDLKVSTTPMEPASNQVAEAVVFHNTGSTPCHIHAYPGVAAVNAQGAQVQQAQRTLRSYFGGVSASRTTPPDIVLQPGQDASDLVQGADMGPDGSGPCTRITTILVTPPNDTRSVRLPWANPDYCYSFLVTPVVPGNSGSQH